MTNKITVESHHSVLSFVTADSEENTEDALTCDAPFQLVHRSCVYFSGLTKLPWDAAREDCKGRNADLMVISDVGELVMFAFGDSVSLNKLHKSTNALLHDV